MPQTTFDKVVHLCEETIHSDSSVTKIKNITQIKDLIVYKEPQLLDNFFEDILGYLIEKSQNIRQIVIDFIESACIADNSFLCKSVERLRFVVEDDSYKVLQKLAKAMITIYRLSLTQAVKSKGLNADEVDAFRYCVLIIEDLLKRFELLKDDDSPSGGFVLMLIKLCESIVILQSIRYPESDVPKMKDMEISLDKVPPGLTGQFLQIDKLEQYGKRLFHVLLKMNLSQSSHIHALLHSLTDIAKQRPQFMSQVIESFELIHVNMPDKLGEVQVNSIRKNLKTNLLSLLKHPSSCDIRNRVTTLLTDLGATQSEISRSIPKSDDIRKRRKKDDINSSGKRMKMNESDNISVFNESVIRRFGNSQLEMKSGKKSSNYVEELSRELIPKLNTVINVADLVLLSMMLLPDSMPPAFQSAYTPIAAAGTKTQISHLSRLLAAQLVSAGYNSLESRRQTEQNQKQDDEMIFDDFSSRSLKTTGSSIPFPYHGNKKYSSRHFNLEAIADASSDAPQNIMLDSYDRILNMPAVKGIADRCRNNPNSSSAIMTYNYAVDSCNLPQWYFQRNKILTTLPSSIFGGAELYSNLKLYSMSDIKNRFDILSALVMQEFIKYKAFQLVPISSDDKSSTPRLATLDDYNALLVGVLLELIRPGSRIKETYFGRMLLEAPLLTRSAMNVLKSYCTTKQNASYGFQVVRDLINCRPSQRKDLVDIIQDACLIDEIDVRNAAIVAAKWVYYVFPQYAQKISDFATRNLECLLQSKPSSSIYPLRHLQIIPAEWTEEVVRPCLYLFLSLMPMNHSLIQLLSKVFVSANHVVKRTIIKMIDIPIKEMGMESEEILRLIESCSNVQDIMLITRIVHILTDKALPTAVLVAKLKDLYHNKFSDVRLIVPILKGLSKGEIIAILPKLVVLSEKVVSEVFRRLLDVASFDNVKGEYVGYSSPILPEELLVAVHQLEFENVELKTVIEASKLCFREKQIFTQERLSIVIGQLLDLSVLPTLFMRTLMQSFSMYPRMVGYVVNVLYRLIKKQVWKNSSLWDGFIRCCGKLNQQSFGVLLQLPVDRLESVFNSVPEFRLHMRKYIENCPQSVKVHVSTAVFNLINSEPVQVAANTPVEKKPSVPVIVELSANESQPLEQTVNQSIANIKVEKISSINKAVIDKEKQEEDRKKREKAKQILEKDGIKISFLPSKKS